VSERHAVRVGAVGVTAAALVLPSFMVVPAKLPATAMGSALLLYLERGLAVFAILLFLLVFLYRSLVHGELPKAISSRERSSRASRRRSGPGVGFGSDVQSREPV
jgi:membrane protein implicated in regulation of membrane protease activity